VGTPSAATVGAGAGGLTGPVSIVVAFRFDVVAVSQEHRDRAAQTVTVLTTTAITAALITIPQPTRSPAAHPQPTPGTASAPSAPTAPGARPFRTWGVGGPVPRESYRETSTRR
jgi:hypothetical protein